MMALTTDVCCLSGVKLSTTSASGSISSYVPTANPFSKQLTYLRVVDSTVGSARYQLIESARVSKCQHLCVLTRCITTFDSMLGSERHQLIEPAHHTFDSTAGAARHPLIEPARASTHSDAGSKAVDVRLPLLVDGALPQSVPARPWPSMAKYGQSSMASQAHIIHQNRATSGFEMCFDPAPQHLWC